MLNFISKHSLAVYTLVFFLMVLSSAALYWSADDPTNIWTWILMASFIISNLLVLFTKK
jgi:uncharacterized membrane protein